MKLQQKKKKMRSFSVLFCRPATLLKKNYIAGGFLYILQNFSEQPFLQNTSGHLLLPCLKNMQVFLSLKNPITNEIKH